MPAEVKKEIELEIAHVLFLDIVGYSKLSVNEQHAQSLSPAVRVANLRSAALKFRAYSYGLTPSTFSRIRYSPVFAHR
jgi:hypothetical protein